MYQPDVYSSDSSKNRNGNNNSDCVRVFILSVHSPLIRILSLHSSAFSLSLSLSPRVYDIYAVVVVMAIAIVPIFSFLSVSALISYWLEFSIVKVTG